MIFLSDISIEKLENISKITLDDLRNPKIFGRLEELVAQIDTYNLLKEANYFLEELIRLLDRYKELAQSEPQLFKDYERLIIYLKFLTLISQPIDEIENLFKKYLLLAIREEIFLGERLRLLFLFSSDEVTGENVRRMIIKAIEANEEKIGKESLVGGVGSPSVYPYVKNWLRDYNSFFSAEKKVRGELEQATYLNHNKNVGKLNNEEKKILIGVIRLYDFLRFSPAEKREVKATGHVPIITSGPPKTEEEVKLGKLKQILSQYPPNSLERKAIEEELDKLESKEVRK